MTNREQQRQRNRERYPEFTAFVDRLRRLDPHVKVTEFRPRKTEDK